MEEQIIFKGTKEGLTLFIKEDLPIAELKEKILDKLNSAGNFFIGAAIRLDMGEIKLEESKIDEIRQMIQSVGLIFAGVVVHTTSEKKDAKKENSDERVNDLANTLLVKKTIRSGQRLNYDGNIVVMGDVNPGAEVIATGDIVVLGRLKGMAHAGAKGNEEATIMAFQLQPIQLRIAEYITRSPDNGIEEPNRPEIVRVREGMMVIEIYTT